MELILKSYHGDTLKNGPGVVFYCHSVRRVAIKYPRRYSSGQRGQTVNLLTYVYEGSNPSRRTRIKKLKLCLGIFYCVRREVNSLGDYLREIRKSCLAVYEQSEINRRQPVLRL